MRSGRKPDIEFTRKLKNGYIKSYGHIYFKPLTIFLFGKVIVGKTNPTGKEQI